MPPTWYRLSDLDPALHDRLSELEDRIDELDEQLECLQTELHDRCKLIVAELLRELREEE